MDESSTDPHSICAGRGCALPNLVPPGHCLIIPGTEAGTALIVSETEKSMLKLIRLFVFLFFLCAMLMFLRGYVVHPGFIWDFSQKGLLSNAALILSAYGTVALGTGIVRSTTKNVLKHSSDPAPTVREPANLAVFPVSFRRHPVLTIFVVTFPALLILFFFLAAAR